MSPFSSETMLTSRVRVQQVIIAALTAGVLVFMGFSLSQSRAKPEGDRGVSLSVIAVIMTVGTLLAREVVSHVIVKSQRRQLANGTWTFPKRHPNAVIQDPPETDGDKLLVVHQTRAIIRGALLEGPAFVCVLAYLTQQDLWILGVAIFLVVLLAASFPTRNGVKRWVKEQLELVELERAQPR